MSGMAMATAHGTNYPAIIIPLGILFNGRNAEMLGKVNRLVPMGVRRNAEHDGEPVLFAGQFLQRHGDLVAGVEFEIEPKCGFTGSNGTRQIPALLATLQHGQIRVEDVGALVRPRAVNQDLGRELRNTQD